MRKLYYIILIVAFAVGCDRKEDPVSRPSDGDFIEFTASAEWPSLSKGIIYDETDLGEDGFVVWSDMEDKNGSIQTVFDRTEVSYPGLEYEPKQRWRFAEYFFAAALPASASFTGGIDYESKKLTLEFGSGLQLGGAKSGAFLKLDNQTDVMVACDYIDNTNGGASTVALNFSHQLAMVCIEVYGDPVMSGIEVDVEEFELYGNYTGAKKVEITYSEDEENVTMNTVWSDFLMNSTSAIPFMKLTPPADETDTTIDWNVSNDIETLANILVLPQTVNNLNFRFDYTLEYSSINESKVNVLRTLSNVTWAANTKYTYRFMIGYDKLILDAVTVAPWGGPAQDIEHEFN